MNIRLTFTVVWSLLGKSTDTGISVMYGGNGPYCINNKHFLAEYKQDKLQICIMQRRPLVNKLSNIDLFWRFI
jgi:hypothetical protein